MHIGPYSTESKAIEKIHGFIKENLYVPNGKHHEIYMGDPRKSAPSKLRRRYFGSQLERLDRKDNESQSGFRSVIEVEPFYFTSYDRVIGVAKDVWELDREIKRLAREDRPCLEVPSCQWPHCFMARIHESVRTRHGHHRRQKCRGIFDHRRKICREIRLATQEETGKDALMRLIEMFLRTQ